MISLMRVLTEQGKLNRTVQLGKDAASLGVDVSKDIGGASYKAGTHVARNKEKYASAALGAGAVLAVQKGSKAIKSTIDKLKETPTTST